MKLRKKWQKILFFIITSLLFSTAFADQNNFKIVRKKELPKQLGIFREIEFTTSNNQTGTIYAATLSQQYQAHLHLHESKIQFFADYIDALSRHHDFIIAINGGFYQPDFTPVGLFKYQGKIIKPLTRSSLLKSCVIINKENKITLETNLSECTKVNNAMQTGPILIQDGKINTELKRMQTKSKSMVDFFDSHKRTLLALTNENQLVMLTTSSLSLMDVANFLQNNPEAFGTSKIKTAVNLDGGSSTGMYVRFPNEPFYFHEIKHVKTFIFVD